MLLFAIGCFKAPTLVERCDRCTDPAAECAPEDARACGELAEIARIADPVDHATAVKLSDRACTHSDGLGCSALGLRFEDGLGLPDDDVRALALFDDACGLGAGVGCFNAGLMYSSGHGVARDMDTANAWFERAVSAYGKTCAAKDHGTCMNLGLMYEQGFGVQKDPAKALSLYDGACKGGYDDACVNAAWMRLDAAATPADEQAGVEAIRAACDRGSPLGCSALGQVYVQNKYGIAADGPRAVELLERACHAGDMMGCNVLGGVLGMGELVPADEAGAIWYSSRACDLGGSGGCFVNGMAAKTRVDAEQWLTRACGMGNPEACYALGSVRATPGEGLDLAGAAKALASACQLGVDKACAGLPAWAIEATTPVPAEGGPAGAAVPTVAP